jgi:hypothetical protein
MMYRLLLILAATSLTGCAAPSVLVELEHVSHPLVGWPINPEDGVEDELTQVSTALRFRKGGLYADAGLGLNLFGANGMGFYGPALTGTIRVGYEFRPFGKAVP